MSATLVEPRLLHASSSARELDSRSGGGGLTLEQLLDSVWEGLRADGAAECPLCHGRMNRAAAHGSCGNCGSTLS